LKDENFYDEITLLIEGGSCLFILWFLKEKIT